MLSYLPGPICGSLSFLLYLFNTLIWVPPLFILMILKITIPFAGFRKICFRLINGIASTWIGINTWNQNLTNRTRLDVEGVDNLEMKEWYLVLSNHQSWVDILVLQRIFHRKIPFLKFFLKKELIWVPIMGPIWWVLDYPFMKRYSRSFLEKNPRLKGKDMEITRKACEKFRAVPVSIMNFVEGTRLTEEKHRLQKSPFIHLLKPKAGGIGFVLGAMGDQLNRILDVTIVYPEGPKSFWAFLCGKVTEVKVRVKSLPVKDEILGDYINDMEFRDRFQSWLNSLWEEKDAYIGRLLEKEQKPIENIESLHGRSQ